MVSLVTGATGFLGQYLVERLCSSDQGVIAVEHVRQGVWWATTNSKRLQVVRGDVRDLEFLRSTIARYEVDTVYHLAAQTQVGIGAADPLTTFDVNVHGTSTVLEACRLEKVKRVLVASSDKVYGECESVDETTVFDPRCPYSYSKACADSIAQCFAANYGMSVVVTRCGNLYGPGDVNYRRLVPSVCRSVARGERPKLRDRNYGVRDYLYVGDAADATIRLAATDYVGPVNLSGGKPMSTMDVANMVQRLGGRYEGLDVELEPHSDDPSHELRHQSLCCDLARQLIGFAPKTQMETGLTWALRWYREQHGNHR